jgi:hypothetical protein
MHVQWKKRIDVWRCVGMESTFTEQEQLLLWVYRSFVGAQWLSVKSQGITCAEVVDVTNADVMTAAAMRTWREATF